MDSVLEEVARRFRSLPALEVKSSLSLVAEVFGASDWVHGPGDDTAVLDIGAEKVLFSGEAIWPPFVETDPFGAGVASVVANVNDVAAMGGRCVALVDQVVASREVARQVLEGMRFAADLYRVPIAGGHLTIREGPPSVSASVLGSVVRPLSAVNVTPGHELLFACCLEGRMRADFPFFSSVRQRGSKLAADVEILARVSEAGLVAAAKDVSMPGILGSLAMLLEPTSCGATLHLEALPRPDRVPLAVWSFAFPTFGFLLSGPAPNAESVRASFKAEGLACETVGWIDDTARLRVRLGGEEAELLDLAKRRVTGLTRELG